MRGGKIGGPKARKRESTGDPNGVEGRREDSRAQRREGRRERGREGGREGVRQDRRHQGTEERERESLPFKKRKTIKSHGLSIGI